MIQMAAEVKKHDIGKVNGTVIDNDEKIRKTLQHEGINATLTKKSGDTIKVGIDLIKRGTSQNH